MKGIPKSGSYLQRFQTQVTSGAACRTGASIAQIETTNLICWKGGNRLLDDRIPQTYADGVLKFDSVMGVKDGMIDDILSQLDKYFSESEHKIYSIFKPTNIKKNCHNERYGEKEVMELAIKFDLDPVNAACGFCLLLIKVQSFDDSMFDPDEDFWQNALKFESSGSCSSEDIIKLLRIILSIPTTSAEIERAFSVYNYIKNERRRSLTANKMDSLIRIRYSKPNLKDFDASYFANKWLETHYPSDHPRYLKRKYDESNIDQNSQISQNSQNSQNSHISHSHIDELK